MYDNLPRRYECSCKHWDDEAYDYKYNSTNIYCEICGKYLDTLCTTCKRQVGPSLCESEGCLEFWKLKNV